MPLSAGLDLIQRSRPDDGAPVWERPSIVVLPFLSLSGPDADGFVAGLMEEIVSWVVRSRSVFVVGAGVRLGPEGRRPTASHAIQNLHVDFALEGSVRRAGGRVRIVASLVDARLSNRLWIERFEDTLSDAFALQDRVAAYVTEALADSVRRDPRRSRAA